MDSNQIVASNSNAKTVHARAAIATVCGVASFRKANARQLEAARRCPTCFPTADAPAAPTTSKKPRAKKPAKPAAEATPATAEPATTTAERNMTSDWTFRLTMDQVEATTKKFEKINARAAKKGMDGELRFTKIERVVEEETHPETGLKVEKIFYECTIGGTAPAYNGWQFIATLDWDEHAGLIVRALPGAAKVDRDGLREGWCDHCQTTRVRRVTYVVRDMNNGTQLQVGRSCIKDFTGWAGTVSWLERNTPSQGEGWFGPAGGVDYTPTTVLATAWAIIKLHGFVPASHHWSSPTRNLVNTALYPNPKNQHEKDFARSLRPLADEATGKAEAIREFIASDDFAGDSDYVLNLKAAAAARGVNPRNFGLLVSAPQAYARHQERTLIRDKAAKQGEDSTHYGEVKKRYELEVTVAGVRYIKGNYGTTTLYTLIDGEGNVFKWFASNDNLGEDEGRRFRIKGTVKAHDQYNGVKQTMLNRCAVVEELEPAPAAA